MTTPNPLGRLLRLDGPEEPSRAAFDRVRDAVEAEWRGVVRRRRRQRWSLAAAAAIGLALVLALVRGTAAPEVAEAVGDLTLTHGSVVVTTPGDRPVDGVALRAGALIETAGDGGAQIDLLRGGQLRIDAGTRVRFSSGDRLTLEGGGLYFDSRTEPGATGLPGRVTVATPFARLWNLGTRYEVRVDRHRLEVAVRAGRVAIETASGARHTGDAGELLAVTAGGSVTRRQLSPSSPRFAWAAELGPAFAIDGRTLEQFFAWIEREAGLEVRLLAEPASRDVRLRGDLVWRDPRAAIAPTLRLAGLRGEIHDGVLLVTD